MKESYLKFGNGHPFEPEPRFYNHACHWAPWAEHFRDAAGVVGTLANMLGSALERIDELEKHGRKESEARSLLLFAYICLVETGKPVPFVAVEPTPSLGEAWASIELLNRWRAENKLNIKAVDV